MQVSSSVSRLTSSKSVRKVPWWEKLIALIAVANLILALFNLTYVPLRDFYIRHIPGIVHLYDPIKGIEPEQSTQKYLYTVDTLEQILAATGEVTPDLEPILADLRQQSEQIIDENPFTSASKLGTFAKIKRRMRQHLDTETAKVAFEKFWSRDYLFREDWETELSFFDHKIRPSINSNYFRNIDDYGQYTDNFWQIDTFFIGFFAIEYLTRTLIISYRFPSTNWFDAMLRRWYDLFLLLPVWRWLRLIPVTVRLHKSKLLDLERAIAQVTYEPAAYLSDRISQFLLVRLINQAKDSIRKGEAARALFQPRPYLEVNNINEIAVITDRLLELTIYKVLPQVQPNLEALLHHSLRRSFQDSGFYQALNRIPGFGNLPNELVENIANRLTQTSVEILTSSYSDEQGKEIFERFSKNFSSALSVELQDKETLAEIELLLVDLLEEVKLNYIARSAEEDPTETLEEVEKLLQSSEHKSA